MRKKVKKEPTPEEIAAWEKQLAEEFFYRNSGSNVEFGQLEDEMRKIAAIAKAQKAIRKGSAK